MRDGAVAGNRHKSGRHRVEGGKRCFEPADPLCFARSVARDVGDLPVHETLARGNDLRHAVGGGERANGNSHPRGPARHSPGPQANVLAARLATLCCPRQAEQRLHGFRVATQSGFKSRERSGLVPSEHLIERGVGIDDRAVGLGNDLRFVRSVGGGLEQICRR